MGDSVRCWSVCCDVGMWVVVWAVGMYICKLVGGIHGYPVWTVECLPSV